MFSSKGQSLREESVILAGRLAEMFEQGVPLTKIFSILIQQQEDFTQVLMEVQTDVMMGGKTLSGALSQHPKIFDQALIEAVKEGEKHGTLDETLQRFVTDLKRSKQGGQGKP